MCSVKTTVFLIPMILVGFLIQLGFLVLPGSAGMIRVISYQ